MSQIEMPIYNHFESNILKRYLNFIENCNKLNELSNYKKLTERLSIQI